ncbi:MAG: hypothetical protein AB7L90_20805 [Hyphomicrobiaceae bacterium]
MLQSLFKRAEVTVDNAIASVLARALVAIPFLVAAGFGTAALAIYAYDNLGVTGGNVLLAVIFCIIGLVCAATVAIRGRDRNTAAARPVGTAPENGDESSEPKPLLDAIDRDVVAAMVRVVGPAALPFMLRSVMRNLPLIAAVAAAGFVLSRTGDGEAKDDNGEVTMQPAE